MERIPLRDNTTGQGLLLVTLAMLALGIVMVHSAVVSVFEPGKWYARVDVRHTVFAAVAALVALTCWRFDYRLLAGGGRFWGLATVLLVVAVICAALVFVPGVGWSVGGDQRWIRIGPRQYSIGFQPSELVKLSLVIFLAGWLSGRPADRLRSFTRTFLPAAGLIGFCVALIITQDFGAGVLTGLAAVVTLLLAGVPWHHLATLIPPAAFSFWALVVRDPRRWVRITAMFDPWNVANPGAYQPRQSLMTVLSGGWFGTGVGRGVQKLGFLPEDSTDFIFAAFCEEWGFFGAVMLMSLVVMWVYLAYSATVRSRDGFGRLLAGSLAFLVAVQAAMHIAVCLVAIPPTGIALPFMSAGGTGLVLMAAAVAMIVSVSSRPAGQGPPAPA
jgi:cell division protein FtsW